MDPDFLLVVLYYMKAVGMVELGTEMQNTNMLKI
jgi:hypothetical protein